MSRERRERADSGEAPVTRYGETWVYESIVGAIPGLSLSQPVAVGVQFAVFEGLILAFAAMYDLWSAVPAGTAAVAVAAAGSYLMLALGEEIRRLETPATYRRLLFSSNIEVVLGVVSFVALLTYLFTLDARSGQVPLLAVLLGETPPAPAVFLTLLVLWDLCYRIGTGWWASLTGLVRTVQYGGEFDEAGRRQLLRIDLLTVGFALVQLLLVPFVWGRRPLVLAIVGHVVAVTLVSGASMLLLARS
ncbi:hypothetical protein M0R88_07825 [Halorussus gelatinilyticus]|uniref:Uncharacterized protein n=1 Tax=Halorussus gelatinilyticus TaxID=2937524 RepID=A0A8U0ILH5_9EURY|nr:hypothetical protein [Halorussus gelatinilyticus]UPW01993.1 hypothetical protein M0R88_07825 [Halorussus gelatinilyticus]